MRTLVYTLLVSLITSFYLCCPSCIRADEPDEKLHLQCLYPTIMIKPEKSTTYGSGVIVRSNKINDNEYLNVFITAAHVVDTYEQYSVKVGVYEDWSTLKTTEIYPAVLYAKNFDRDIAIGMFLSEEKMPCAVIDMNSKFYIGNDVFHVGCGVSDEPRIDYGKITALRSRSGDVKYPLYRTSAHTVPGDSGGPLFNKYRVIGLCRSIRTWRNFPVFNMSYYTPITYLKEWSEEEDGAYDFVWKERAIPKMAFWELHFAREWEIITKVP